MSVKGLFLLTFHRFTYLNNSFKLDYGIFCVFVVRLNRSITLNIGDKTIANDTRSARDRDKTIMNERIRSKEVRLIDEKGTNHGVVPTSKALAMAEEADLDLVLISPNQAPPVAKILDYGKYKYELAKKAKEAKKKQKTVEVKEVKVRYKIDTHDYEVRIKSVRKFIAQGNKVKIVVMLRGREMQHSNLAFDLANRFLADLADDPVQLEKKPQLEGRNVTLYLAPQS